MKAKRKAPVVGSRSGAIKAIEINNLTLSIRGGRRIVNIDLEKQGNILGGILFGASMLAISIIIPVLLGGY